VLNEAASASLDRLLDEAERTETYLYESYGRYKPSDRTIAEAFEKKLPAAPDNFALPT